MTTHRKVEFLTSSQIDMLHERSFRLLGDKGVKMDHPFVMERLDEAGAHVDFQERRVRFPAAFVQGALDKVPKTLTLAGADPAHDLEVPRVDGTFHVRTGTGARSYIDPDSGLYRDTTISDVAGWARLADALDQVGFCAFPSPMDVPGETADVHALRAMLENTGKHIWIQPYSAASIGYLVEMAVAAAGDREALRRRPLVSFIACALTPLDFKFMDLEVILQASRHGIPVHACSLPGAGSTAPVTMPGTLLLAAAETLVQVVVAQTLQPGIPVIATPLIFTLDMLTGRSLQSSAESIQGAAAIVQFLRSAYEVPTHTYGFGADSPEIDGQSMIERALLASLVASAGADILGGAGQLEVATAISPIQLVIDNEMAGMLRRVVSGLKVDDESLAWEDLLAVSPGGHFLSTDHTVRHCRDHLRPQHFVRQSREVWDQKGRKDLIARAKEAACSLMTAGRPRPLPEGKNKEMDAIVGAADRHLHR